MWGAKAEEGFEHRPRNHSPKSARAAGIPRAMACPKSGKTQEQHWSEPQDNGQESRFLSSENGFLAEAKRPFWKTEQAPILSERAITCIRCGGGGVGRRAKNRIAGGVGHAFLSRQCAQDAPKMDP